MTAVAFEDTPRVSRVVATYDKATATLICATCGEALPMNGHPPQFVVTTHYLSRSIETAMKRNGRTNLPARPFDAGGHDEQESTIYQDSFIELVDYDPLIYLVEIPRERCHALVKFLTDGKPA